MKILVVLAAILLPLSSLADCMYIPQRVIQIEVWLCQSTVIRSDERNTVFHSPSSELKGTLITGSISENTVLANGRNYGESNENFAWVKGQNATLFLADQANEVCGAYEIREQARFITVPTCCDTLPADGICLLPDGIPQVEPEHVPKR